MTKNMIGSTPACPRHRRTARAVSRASVPLHSAMANSSVTPMSVTSRSVGNPSRTALGVMPPRNTPTMSAIAIDRTPTLIVVMQLRVTASTSAPTEIQARFIGRRLRPAALSASDAHQLADVGQVLERFDHREGLLPRAAAGQHQRRAVAELLVQLLARERQVGAAAIALVGVLDERAAVLEVDFDACCGSSPSPSLRSRDRARARPFASSPAPARSGRTRR